MNQIPPKNIFLAVAKFAKLNLEKSESKVGSDLGHPSLADGGQCEHVSTSEFVSGFRNLSLNQFSMN